MTTTFRLVAVLAVSAVLGACASDVSERPVNPAPTLSPPVTAPSTSAPVTIAVPTPVSTTAPVTTALTAATTLPAEPTTTSTPPAARELVLRPDGVGGARFGADAEQVIAYVTGIAGPPTADSGWVDALASPFGACSGPRVRGVEWGQLQLLFGDETSVSTTPEHFFHYNYGSFTGQPVSPAGLMTDAGLGVGSTLGQFRSAYPGLTVFEDPIFGAGFSVTQGGLSASLTDATDAGRALVLYGGIGCGE